MVRCIASIVASAAITWHARLKSRVVSASIASVICRSASPPISATVRARSCRSESKTLVMWSAGECGEASSEAATRVHATLLIRCFDVYGMTATARAILAVNAIKIPPVPMRNSLARFLPVNLLLHTSLGQPGAGWHGAMSGQHASCREPLPPSQGALEARFFRFFSRIKIMTLWKTGISHVVVIGYVVADGISTLLDGNYSLQRV